jgi:hypothetical protein
MKKILIFLAIFLIPIVSAQLEDINNENFCIVMQKEFNGTEFNIPKYIPYGNERMNIYLSPDEFLANLVTEDRKLKSIGCKEVNDPTYNIYIKKFNVVEEIKESDNPIDFINDKIKNKEIDIQGVTASKKIKGFFTKITIRIASWFM